MIRCSQIPYVCHLKPDSAGFQLYGEKYIQKCHIFCLGIRLCWEYTQEQILIKTERKHNHPYQAGYYFVTMTNLRKFITEQCIYIGYKSWLTEFQFSLVRTTLTESLKSAPSSKKNKGKQQKRGST